MDLEARAHSEHPDELRLWLRLLTCTQLIEKQVRNELREQFATTLPRFDLMSQLERSQFVAHLLLDQLGAGEQPQPEAQGLGVLAVGAGFHVHGGNG